MNSTASHFELPVLAPLDSNLTRNAPKALLQPDRSGDQPPRVPFHAWTDEDSGPIPSDIEVVRGPDQQPHAQQSSNQNSTFHPGSAAYYHHLFSGGVAATEAGDPAGGTSGSEGYHHQANQQQQHYVQRYPLSDYRPMVQSTQAAGGQQQMYRYQRKTSWIQTNYPSSNSKTHISFRLYPGPPGGPQPPGPSSQQQQHHLDPSTAGSGSETDRSSPQQQTSKHHSPGNHHQQHGHPNAGTANHQGLFCRSYQNPIGTVYHGGGVDPGGSESLDWKASWQQGSGDTRLPDEDERSQKQQWLAGANASLLTQGGSGDGGYYLSARSPPIYSSARSPPHIETAAAAGFNSYLPAAGGSANLDNKPPSAAAAAAAAGFNSFLPRSGSSTLLV